MKKIISLLISLLMVVGLSGCHGKKAMDAFVVPEEFDDSKDYEIVFWAKNDTNKLQVETYDRAIKSFETLYPNIHISVKYYTDYTRIYNDVITNIQTQTTPNVCICYPDHVATYVTGQNVVVSLDELIDNEKYGLSGSKLKFEPTKKEEIVPEYLNECMLSEKCYMLPFVRSTEACYINKTYVEELGYEIPDILTWDFIFEVSEKALEKNENGLYKINNQNVMIPFIYKSTDNMMIQMLRQLDGGYSNSDGDVLLFNETTKRILKEIAPHSLSYAFSTFKIDSYPGNFINAGQCLFGIDSTAGATWMGPYAAHQDIDESKLVDFEMAVRMIPQYDPSNPKMISQGPSICVFNKADPQEVLASWMFAQFLLTNDIQLSYSETEGYVPVTLKAQKSDEYQQYLNNSGLKDLDDNGNETGKYYYVKIDATKLLIDNVHNTFVTPVYNGSTSLRNAAGQLVEEVTKGIRRGNTIDDKYIDDLFSRMNSLYKLDENTKSVNSKKELGELPAMSKTLLISLAVVWVGIISYNAYEFFKKKPK